VGCQLVHCRCTRQGKRGTQSLTLELDHVPKPREAHELAVLGLGEVRQLLVALFQPLVEALRDDDAALLLLHRRPHAAVFDERVVTAVDRLHLAAVVGVALGPERDESPGGALASTGRATLLGHQTLDIRH